MIECKITSKLLTNIIVDFSVNILDMILPNETNNIFYVNRISKELEWGFLDALEIRHTYLYDLDEYIHNFNLSYSRLSLKYKIIYSLDLYRLKKSYRYIAFMNS